MGGAAQAVMETKDFLLGNTPDAEKSEGRKNVEAGVKKLGKESVVDGVVAGVSQFATGLLGAGKLMAGAKVTGWLGTASRTTQVGAEVGKAAAVGAIAFDPHAERLSNLVERFPAISNPVSRYLAADPKDSAAEGRMKNAMESIGLDAVLIGTFLAGTKALRALKGGDATAIQDATLEQEGVIRAGEAPSTQAAPLVGVELPKAPEAVPSPAAGLEAPRVRGGGVPAAPAEGVQVSAGPAPGGTASGDMPPAPGLQAVSDASRSRGSSPPPGPTRTPSRRRAPGMRRSGPATCSARAAPSRGRSSRGRAAWRRSSTPGSC